MHNFKYSEVALNKTINAATCTDASLLLQKTMSAIVSKAVTIMTAIHIVFDVALAIRRDRRHTHQSITIHQYVSAAHTVKLTK